eukprot:1136624-Pelagomonas_calceolata.AAC.3
MVMGGHRQKDTAFASIGFQRQCCLIHMLALVEVTQLNCPPQSSMKLTHQVSHTHMRTRRKKDNKQCLLPFATMPPVLFHGSPSSNFTVASDAWIHPGTPLLSMRFCRQHVCAVIVVVVVVVVVVVAVVKGVSIGYDPFNIR